MEKNSKGGHIATIKYDECLALNLPCLLVASIVSKNGHTHLNKDVYYYPDEIFAVEDNYDQKMFFVPSILMGIIKPEKVPIPLFMIDFSQNQIEEIIMTSKKSHLKISKKHFVKPQITISYEEDQKEDEMEEFGEEILDDAGKN